MLPVLWPATWAPTTRGGFSDKEMFLHIGAALVNVARCVEQEMIANVSPAVAFLMQALYAFYLDFSLVNI